ncbi:MAG: M43 family zinc metalloprotease, partial [Saprospiraceae bacterium]|nr:M43 family zinc metalloprotease [Saprospiraceae bacterium]
VAFLNDAFANAGYFGGLGASADVPFRFCLAQQTPDVLATSGITRTQSSLTDVFVNPQDPALKNLIRWDPTRYVNVWVVKSIFSAVQGTPYAGYATLPFSHGSNFDGIVIGAEYTGSSFLQQNTVLAHEMGHFLGLYHTFEGSCPNDDCLQQGDRVCDTPPDQATFSSCYFNSCHTDIDAPAPNPLTMDVNDMTENFMDYSPWSCVYRFTPGQSDRMLQLSESLRSSLFISTGCFEPCLEGTLAAFMASTNSINVGDTVFFTNNSQNALSYAWYVDGELQSTEQDFKFIPSTIANYQILLLANGAGSNCFSSYHYNIQAVCNLNGFIESSALETTPGGSITFQAQVEHADHYQWTVNGVPAGQNALMNWTFPTTGNYLIALSTVNDHCATVFSMIIPVNAYCTPAAPPQIRYRLPYSTITGLAVIPNGDMLLSSASFLSRIRQNGSVAWTKVITPDLGNLQIINQTPDHGVIALSNNRYLMRWDSNGQLLWSSMLAPGISPIVAPDDFTASLDGSFLLRGVISDSLIWVCFSMEGEELWRVRMPNLGYGTQRNIAATNGGYYINLQNPSEVSSSTVCISKDGIPKWGKKYQPIEQYNLAINNMVAEQDGGFSFTSENYLVRCNQDGEVIWAKKFTSSNSEFSSSASVFLIKTKGKGYYFSTATSNFLNDVQYFMELDSMGELLWGFQIKLEELCYTPAASAQGPVFPIKDPLFANKLYLMRPNNHGFAGGCAEQPFSVNVSSAFITSSSTSIPLQYAPVQAVTPAPLNIEDYDAKLTVGCPQFPICAEICDNQGVDDDRNGYPDCFDAPCGCLDNPSCFSTAKPDNFQCRIAWESPLKNINIAGVPLVANLDRWNNSIPEIVIQQTSGYATGKSPKILIFNGDGSDALTPSEITLSTEAYPGGQLAIGDLDGNQHAEILAIHDYKVSAFTNYGSSNAPSTWGSTYSNDGLELEEWRPQLTDFNQDGNPEVYAGNRIMIMDTSIHRFIRAIRGDASKPHGRLAYRNALYKTAQTLAAELLTRSNCNGDPDCDGLELAAGPVIYSVDLDGWDGDAHQLTIQRDLNTQDTSLAVWSDGFTSVADIDLNHTPDLVVAGKRDSIHGVYVWNRNGLLAFFPYPENTAFSGSMPCIANVINDQLLGYDNDYPEIIASSQNRLTCFSLNAWMSNPASPYWWSISTSDSIGLATPVAFDFNTDGLDELVFQDEAQLRLMYAGAEPLPPGVDPNRNWHVVAAPTVTGTQYPVVADCDGDGEAEIIFTSFDVGGPDEYGSLRGRLRVLEAANVPWPPARPIWNQYGYSGTHITDDLSIPVHPLESHKPIGGNLIYNRFLGQAPVLNQQFEPFIYLPNAVISVDSSWCDEEQVHFRVNVCNQGDHVLPDSLPIRFYDAHPVLLNASPWGDLYFLHPGELAPGDCASQVLSLPVSVKGQILYGMLNDNGLNSTPLDLNQNFKPAKSFECSFWDNLFTISKDWTTPVLDLGSDLVSCSANAVTLQADPAFARYRWQDGFPEAQYTASGPGKYWVDAWDECGFKQSDTVLISLSAMSHLELGEAPIICPGDTLHFSVSGFENVTWTPAQLVDCATCPNVQLAPVVSVLLVSTGVAGNCIASDSVSIHVRQAPEITQIASTTAQQQMNNGSAWVVVMGGQAPYQIIWNTMPPQFGDSIFHLPAGMYQVRITDAAGCQTTGNVTVDQTLAASTAEPIPFQLHPNPAGKQFILEWPMEAIQLLVFNALGEQILVKDLAQKGHSLAVDCSNWAAGTYDVVLRTTGSQWTRKLVVLR